MVPHPFYLFVNTLEVILGIVVLCLLIRERELKTYWPLLGMCMWQAPAYFVLLYLRTFEYARMSPNHAYRIYFFTFWPAFGISALCSILLTYTIFHTAMQPLKGLQSLGKIMYSWAAVISMATALSVVFNPGSGEQDAVLLAVSQLQRSSAILILSLVAFVAIAIRPMGLSIRSRVFGVSVGTMIVSATNLMQANYLLHLHALYNPYALIEISSSCVCEIVWIYYFSVPEPKRKFILLPTTSPFHHWNRISELLGHEPGFVAIGGIPPESFSGAEIDIFRRASAKMKEVADEQKQTSLPTH